MRTFLPRIIAFVIDAFIGALPALMMLPIAITLLTSDSGQNQFVGRYLIALSIFPALLFFLLVSFFQVARGRQTVGRRIASIELVRKDGAATGPLNALLRTMTMATTPLLIFFLALPPLLLLLPACGALLDSQGRAPWDLVAGTEIRPAADNALEAEPQHQP